MSRQREGLRTAGRQRGESAYPQMRFVSLVENGTHVLFGTRWGLPDRGNGLGPKVAVPAAEACCVWRTGNFSASILWNKARATGAELLWRVEKNLRLPWENSSPDGSYLSRIYPPKDRRRQAQWSNGASHRISPRRGAWS